MGDDVHCGDGHPVLRSFHPVVSRWFRERFAGPTAAQRDGWPLIAARRDVLIAAPTGSGKTLAAFLASIDSLIRLGDAGELDDRIEVLYVSPLKALSNDVQRNLDEPLAQLREVACAQGISLPVIRTALRTGDTPQSERAKLVRKPPHILITTPESLFILLTAEKSRAALASVKTVIVDEIHALAGNKRGSHLSLSLARLDALVTGRGGEAPSRIGLSATQKPIEGIARFLVGNSRPAPVILDGGHARDIDLQIEATDDELGAVASNEQFGRVYDRIAELCLAHETTLVFVNTRRLVEQVSHALEKRLGEEQVVAHHGSLSRQLRFAAEQKLKTGKVRCAVATASLELGIDVGSVDLVVQIGSPRSIATLLQRIGRSGHSLGKTPKGRLFALTRDQLAESAALVRAIKDEILDEISIPSAPLDVLCQQIVGEVACGEWHEDELFDLLRSAMPYAELARSDYDSVLEILSEGIATSRGRSRAHLHRDRINKMLRPRRGARLSAITNAGTIPDNFNYRVVTFPDETPVGTLDEDFAIESHAGDIFLLGNTSWQIHRLEAGRVLVRDAGGAPPNIPFWLGEAPARTKELSTEVARLRQDVEARIHKAESLEEISAFIAVECNMPRPFADQLAAYLKASHNALGALPSSTCIIAERFFDSAGGMQLVLHSPFGGRINKAWGLALRKRFCRSFNLELQAAATDDGLLLSLGPVHSFVLESVFEFLKSHSVRKVLRQAVLGSPAFGIRWRWSVTRSLAVLRRNGGKAVAPTILRMRSDDLLSTVFPMQQACLENVVGDIEIPEHPLVDETMRDCLEEFMDIDGLEAVLAQIESGHIRVLARETSEPSPLCHELVNANPYAFLDDAPLEERRTRAVSLPRGLDLGKGDLTAIDDEAVNTAESNAAPTIRDADELHDALMSLMVLRPDSQWSAFAVQLQDAGRATVLQVDEQKHFWVAAERLPLVQAAYPDATCSPVLPALPYQVDAVDAQSAHLAIVRAHLEQLGPRSAQAVCDITALSLTAVLTALAALEAQGILLQGRYTMAARQAEVDQWCDKRMLARIQRLTIARLRKEIEPVDAATLNRFLFRWQRVGQEARLISADGLRQIIEQLQGFQSAAGGWESEILRVRLHNYNPDWLDMLCLSGQVAWARLSPKQIDPDKPGKSAPTRAAPLTLMLRDDMHWLRACAVGSEPEDLSENARAVTQVLRERGASFLRELISGSGLAAQTVEDALWELVAQGHASADGFTSLRLLVDRHKGHSRSVFDAKQPGATIASTRWRSTLKKSRKRDSHRSAHAALSVAAAAGRWALLPAPDAALADPMRHAQQLLQRYGVVFRDLLQRETALPPWRDILQCLRRLEARGEIRGGRFVHGFVGEQFALPEAVVSLRALRRRPPDVPELVIVAATDPLNLVGITSSGPRVSSQVGSKILYRSGIPIASLEAGELRMLTPLEDGARVDGELRYHPPPHADFIQQQELLPLN